MVKLFQVITVPYIDTIDSLYYSMKIISYCGPVFYIPIIVTT